MDDRVVVLTQRQPRWVLVVIGVVAAIVGVMAVGVVLAGDPRRLLSFLPVAGPLAFGFAMLARPPRVELRERVLVTRYLRTVRIPYDDIASVHGDVPSRLDWSTRLIVERRAGKPVSLPPLDAPLPEVHAAIMGRVVSAS